LTPEDKTGEIARINSELSALREQANSAGADTKGQVEKRDKLNEKFKKLRQEIRELKNERDNLNEKVKTLKQQRDEARVKIKAHIEQIKAHNERISDLKKKAPRENRREMRKEFDDIEWKIQTTSLDMQEEKRLMERVKQLETQLSVYKKINQHIKAIAELRKALEPFEADAEAAHKELTDIAERSQDIHVKMMGKIEESKEVKAEADSLHGAYVQVREQVRPLREEIKRLMEQKRKLQASVREEDAKRKKSAEQELKEKLGSQAKDKLARGEKVSWDEFRMLADDESADSEAQD
jgi:uncharacterized coiled-coil DUF342 family protein